MSAQQDDVASGPPPAAGEWRGWLGGTLAVMAALLAVELALVALLLPAARDVRIHLWLCLSAMAMWALIVPVAAATARRWPFAGGWRNRRLMTHFVASLLVGTFTTTLRAALLAEFMPAEDFRLVGGSFATFWRQAIVGALMIESMVYFAVVSIVQWRDTQARALKSNAEAARARMLAIQNSLSPHFTLNAMNALVAMLPESSREQHFAIQIGGFLRDMLDARNTTTQSLGQEMAMVERYLDIERTRLGHRLDASTAMDVFLRDVEVPVLVLQPLVENAIRHAVAPYREGGSLRVEVLRDAGATVLRVESMASEPLRSSPGTGYGEDSSRSRFGLLYGKRVDFDSGRIGERAYRVEIRIRD